MVFRGARQCSTCFSHGMHPGTALGTVGGAWGPGRRTFGYGPPQKPDHWLAPSCSPSPWQLQDHQVLPKPVSVLAEDQFTALSSTQRNHLPVLSRVPAPVSGIFLYFARPRSIARRTLRPTLHNDQGRESLRGDTTSIPQYQ